MARVTGPGYNSLENPIGIETSSRRRRSSKNTAGYNSLENPIGIETYLFRKKYARAYELQLIRKPDRD